MHRAASLLELLGYDAGGGPMWTTTGTRYCEKPSVAKLSREDVVTTFEQKLVPKIEICENGFPDQPRLWCWDCLVCTGWIVTRHSSSQLWPRGMCTLHTSPSRISSCLCWSRRRRGTNTPRISAKDGSAPGLTLRAAGPTIWSSKTTDRIINARTAGLGSSANTANTSKSVLAFAQVHVLAQVINAPTSKAL